MNIVYDHKNINNKNILFRYFISLIPLILYGIYKNGLLLISSFGIKYTLKSILIIILPLIINLLFNFLKEKKVNITYNTFYWACIGLFIPPSINMPIYTISLLIFNLLALFKAYKVNWPLIFKLCLILVLIIIDKYSYLNILETISQYSFSIIDYIFGRSVGGIASTSIIWAVTSYIILASSGYYKKDIPIIFATVYILLGIIRILFGVDFYTVFSNFGGIFIAVMIYGAHNIFSPYLPKARIVYSVLLAIISFFFSILFKYEGVFISILLMNFISILISKFFNYLRSTK